MVLTQRLQNRGTAPATNTASESITPLPLGPEPGQAMQTGPIEIIRGGKMFSGPTPAAIPRDEETTQLVENDWIRENQVECISHPQHCSLSGSFDEATSKSYEIISCCLGPCQQGLSLVFLQTNWRLLGADNGEHSEIMLTDLLEGVSFQKMLARESHRFIENI